MACATTVDWRSGEDRLWADEGQGDAQTRCVPAFRPHRSGCALGYWSPSPCVTRFPSHWVEFYGHDRERQ